MAEAATEIVDIKHDGISNTHAQTKAGELRRRLYPLPTQGVGFAREIRETEIA